MSAVPDLLKIGAIPSNLNMSVETGILDPVVQNDSFIRFNMKRSGFLHSNSKLVLSLSKKDVANWRQLNAHSMLPQGVGVGSLVQRVRLLSGNTVIQEIEDWGDLHAYRSTFISNENNKEREQFTTGRGLNMNHEFKDDDTLDSFNIANPAAPLTFGNPLRSDTRADAMTIDQGTDWYSHSFVTENIGTNNADAENNWDKRLQRFQYLENEPVWQVSLQDLCPFLKQTQLPLFMFTEEIYLEITFSAPKRRAITNEVYAATLGNDANGVQVTPDYTINPVESKLIIDYITYPNETMEAWAQANQNLSFQYYDYELSKFTVTEAGATSGFIRNCGGAGKVVNKVVMGLQRDGQLYDSVAAAVTGTNLIQEMNGGFEARHPPVDVDKSRERVVTNLRYNTEFLYPIDVKNDAYHFNNVLQAEGQPPMVTRALYCGQGAGTSTRGWDGIQQSTSLTNDYFWQCFKLNKNNRINQKGIELYQQMIDGQDITHTLRIWLEVVKVAQLVNGKLETDYA